MSETSTYSPEELVSIYELGRLYYEMGYLVPAERIFAGLVAVDGNHTAARIGLGLLKIERGLFQEATNQFRLALQANSFPLQAKLGLVIAFLGMQELPRARSLLGELTKEMNGISPEVSQLARVLATRCGLT